MVDQPKQVSVEVFVEDFPDDDESADKNQEQKWAINPDDVPVISIFYFKSKNGCYMLIPFYLFLFFSLSQQLGY